MAKDILGEAGLHFDELNKLRVLDPEVAQQTTELKEECRLFVDSKSSWLIGRESCPSIQQSQDDVVKAWFTPMGLARDGCGVTCSLAHLEDAITGSMFWYSLWLIQLFMWK